MKRRDFVRLAGLALVLGMFMLILAGAAGERRRDLTHPANVRAWARPEVRVRELSSLIEKAMDDLEAQNLAESDRDFLQRYDNIQHFLLRIAWFESIQLQYRKQIFGPARSLYQIEPIRAMSGCRTAQEQGWLDDLASACEVSTMEIADACSELTPTYWPPNNLIELCLMQNDLFASYMARICMPGIGKGIPGDIDRQGRNWAGRWKRAFESEEQRSREIEMFVGAAERLEPFLPTSESE